MPIEHKQAVAISRDLEAARQSLVQKLLRWTPEQGLQETALEGVDLIRSDEATSCVSSVYEPSLGFLIQGKKTLQLGDKEISYGPLNYIASSVHLPVLGQVENASPEQPFLAIRLVIDPQEVTDLVLELGDKAPELEAEFDCPEINCALAVARMDAGILDAVSRLVGLLDTPADAPILAPLARREIIYRALMGDMGARMRKFASVDSQANRISRVIAVLKDRFSEPLRISDLADEANMSESSLYHSFKQVTRMSPLQFQKKLRLHEARRLMLTEGIEAASASYRVGYESPSHFSREYSRLFGLPPRADVSKLRGEQRVPA
ncbi:AraC family transcriptional regulator [Microbulbifer marinus]|uniref:Transcriptional regulator, AraC family n=1 Tax=Microbulbifer marinus TaxID=658218 RepID=A0A1H4AHM8_9GAMM|nr:AraC family transcriptional regulator [Microbulbifer marinus]SEA35509.1 transcriptional regulator, AraC family [Microbulbifer marinus]